MSEGLLGDALAEVAADSKSAEKRRVKLFPWDSVATQLLEPYGESSFDTLSLEKLYAATAKGNKGAAYHSHLCAPMDTDPWHVGAGISLTAAALLAAINKFRSEEMQALLKPELYAKVREELVELEPVLKRLNLGRGSQVTRDAGSFREAKKQKTGHATSEPVASTPDEMKQAAFAFHKWLKQPRSFPQPPLHSRWRQHVLHRPRGRNNSSCRDRAQAADPGRLSDSHGRANEQSTAGQHNCLEYFGLV